MDRVLTVLLALPLLGAGIVVAVTTAVAFGPGAAPGRPTGGAAAGDTAGTSSADRTATRAHVRAGAAAGRRGPDRTGPLPPRTVADTMRGHAPLNVSHTHGAQLLRVAVRGGTMIHLVPRAEAGCGGRPAVWPRDLATSSALRERHDRVALDRACWTRRTMCGLPWRCVADDAAEVDAMTASVARVHLPGVTVCPICTARANGRD
jgi:hypothetical protein